MKNIDRKQSLSLSHTNPKLNVRRSLPLAFWRFQSRGDQQRPKRHAPFAQESHLWGKLPQADTKCCSRGYHMSYHLRHLLYSLQILNTQFLLCSLHLIRGVAHLLALSIPLHQMTQKKICNHPTILLSAYKSKWKRYGNRISFFYLDFF